MLGLSGIHPQFLAGAILPIGMRLLVNLKRLVLVGGDFPIGVFVNEGEKPIERSSLAWPGKPKSVSR